MTTQPDPNQQPLDDELRTAYSLARASVGTELERKAIDFFYHVHLSGVTDRFEALIKEREDRARVEEIQLLIGTHNNDLGVERYDILKIDRELFNKRMAQLNKSSKEGKI